MSAPIALLAGPAAVPVALLNFSAEGEPSGVPFDLTLGAAMAMVMPALVPLPGPAAGPPRPEPLLEVMLEGDWVPDPAAEPGRTEATLDDRPDPLIGVGRAPSGREPIANPPITRAPNTRAPNTSASNNPAPNTSVPIATAPITSPPTTSAPISSAAIRSTAVSSAPINITPINITPINITPINVTPINGALINGVPINGTPIINRPPIGPELVAAGSIDCKPIAPRPAVGEPIEAEPMVLEKNLDAWLAAFGRRERANRPAADGQSDPHEVRIDDLGFEPTPAQDRLIPLIPSVGSTTLWLADPPPVAATLPTGGPTPALPDRLGRKAQPCLGDESSAIQPGIRRTDVSAVEVGGFGFPDLFGELQDLAAPAQSQGPIAVPHSRFRAAEGTSVSAEVPTRPATAASARPNRRPLS